MYSFCFVTDNDHIKSLFYPGASLLSMEKAMATHSSTLAWKIPWTEEPGRLQSMTTERLHFHFSFSCIGEGNGNPLQCSCLENPRDRGPWWAAVYGVAQSRTRLKRLSSSSSRVRGLWSQPLHLMPPFSTSPPSDPLPRIPSVAGRIMMPPRCPRLNPPDIIGQKELTEVIKFRIISWGDFPERWCQCCHMGPYRKEAGVPESEKI